MAGKQPLKKKEVKSFNVADFKNNFLGQKTAKTAAAKKASPAKKTAEKAKTVKSAVKKETVKIQFGGEEFDLTDIKSAVEADYKSKFSGRVKTVEIYFKPEEKAVYYVVNSDFSEKIVL